MKSKLKIVLFHPSELPPKNYGGTERVVLWLAKGLAERGHEVGVAAYPGSRLPEDVKLLEVHPQQNSLSHFFKKIPVNTDVLHLMAPTPPKVWDQLPCAGVLTVHGNGKSGEQFPKNSVFLSQDHARRHGADVFVYNGLDPSEYLFEPSQKKQNFLFLSKTSWRVKNLRGTIRLCESARVPLWIAGGERPILERIRVALNSRMEWMGPVAVQAKAKLLASARALLFPVLWPEPFGLVVAEALISGTPVIASPRGSLKELVSPEVGALLDPEREKRSWVELLKSRELPWDSMACRQWALERFHYKKMAESYEFFYRKILSGQSLNEKTPVAVGWRIG